MHEYMECNGNVTEMFETLKERSFVEMLSSSALSVAY